MKRLFIIALLLAMSLSTYGQYNKLTLGAKIGVSKIRDVTPVQKFNFGVNARYMNNEFFGTQLELDHSKLDLYTYNSASIYGVINVGRLLRFEDFSKRITILTGVGGNLMNSKGATNKAILFRKTNFHLTAFSDIEYKLNKRTFLKAGINVIDGVNLERGVPYNSNQTETTKIINFNLGVSVALGKHKEHADWYLRRRSADTIYLSPTIIDNSVTTIVEKSVLQKEIVEHIYFKHNSSEVLIQGLNAMEKIAESADENSTIYVKGYCSNIGSSEYNKSLAYRRCFEVVEKLHELTSLKNIKFEAIGIDESRGKSIYDLSRRVDIIIK